MSNQYYNYNHWLENKLIAQTLRDAIPWYPEREKNAFVCKELFSKFILFFLLFKKESFRSFVQRQ